MLVCQKSLERIDPEFLLSVVAKYNDSQLPICYSLSHKILLRSIFFGWGCGGSRYGGVAILWPLAFIRQRWISHFLIRLSFFFFFLVATNLSIWFLRFTATCTPQQSEKIRGLLSYGCLATVPSWNCEIFSVVLSLVAKQPWLLYIISRTGAFFPSKLIF